MNNKCPISGQECPNHKCIHITEVNNYEAVETKNMCAYCGIPYLAQEGGPDFDTGAAQIFQVLDSIFKNPDISEAEVVMQPTMVVPGCPGCGYTIEEFARTGKLGCGSCYEYFKKELLPIIHKCQFGATQHQGKVPKNNPDVLKKLEDELKEAIAKEDYERAGILKEEIRKLKTGE